MTQRRQSFALIHRHVNPSSFSLAAVDEVICRSGWWEWIKWNTVQAACANTDTLSFNQPGDDAAD